jgi:O-acetyl-ADP-ribose deacetylase (regulator of RNase III)
MPITYIKGDATRPNGEGNKIIVHICNDVGAWGAGFVLALSKRWKAPEIQYRNWKRGIAGEPFELGFIQAVRVEPSIWLCNCLAQHGTHAECKVPPIRYHALQDCLKRVAMLSDSLKASIHMPRIGCGLAGGTWDMVGRIVEQELGQFDVTVYDL